MKVLVTGGAGYIGSHTCKALALQGHEVVVYDNLSTGHRALVRWGDFEYGDIRDAARLSAVLRRHKPDGCIHFASSIAVGESVIDPGKYYDNNVIGSLRIMECLRDSACMRLVVSGTAAVYGLPEVLPIAETSPLAPINPYGRTKLIMEWMLNDFALAHNLQWTSLRYFNAAGGDAAGETGEWHDPETHLIPNVLRAIDGDIPALRLFGDDYDTPDGTCIRDYIHVSDLAVAHVLALEYLLAGKPSMAMNLGTGTGISVREILDAAARVTGRPVPHSIEGRRAGDPARLVADSHLAQKTLGWTMSHSDISTILATAWAWHCQKKGK
ncbi:MAG: UDP-glucose 4-epimerase GalE [Desulfovibrionaceae bacterium]